MIYNSFLTKESIFEKGNLASDNIISYNSYFDDQIWYLPEYNKTVSLEELTENERKNAMILKNIIEKTSYCIYFACRDGGFLQFFCYIGTGHFAISSIKFYTLYCKITWLIQCYSTMCLYIIINKLPKYLVPTKQKIISD